MDEERAEREGHAASMTDGEGRHRDLPYHFREGDGSLRN